MGGLPKPSAAILRESSQTSLAERRLLLDCLDTLSAGAEIVELGTAQGGTTRILAEYANAHGMHVTTVDLATPEILRESLAELGVDALRAPSHEPGRYWSDDRRVDLLIVDADHSWFGVRADWEAWRERLADGAIVLFHDVSPCCPGEFVYVLDRIFHGELGDVRSHDTLTGGRFQRVVTERELTPRGRDLFVRTIEAPLALWPAELRTSTPAQPRRFPARFDYPGKRTLSIFATLGLRPDDSIDAPLVVDTLRGAHDGIADRHIVCVDRHLRDALPMRLLQDGDPRFCNLFPQELQKIVHEMLRSWSVSDRGFLANSGVMGRCPLLDFVEPGAIERALTELGPTPSTNASGAPIETSRSPLDSSPILEPSFR